MSKLRPPIPWFGGKQLMAGKLVPLFPPHKSYVEVFGGAGALLFAKEPSPTEVYNDLDSDLVNFMRVLRDRDGMFPDFYNRACLSPYSRKEWQFCREHLNDDPNPVERARRFFVLARFSFSGLVGNSFGISICASKRGMVQQASAYQGVLGILPKLSDRMVSVLVENKDFRNLIEVYDREETFFYLDPPYLPSTRKSGAYKHEMSEDDHKGLVEILKIIKGKVMLSGYPSELYYTLGWKRLEWNVSSDLASSSDAEARQEATILAWGQRGLDEETAARMTYLLEDERPKIRRWASLALFKHSSLSNADLVLHNLADDDYLLREWSAHVLSPLASTKALPYLIDLFEHDPAPRVREWTARALANYHDQDVRELLYERCREELDAFVREAIMVGIAVGAETSRDRAFLAETLQREMSPVVVGELIRVITASRRLSEDVALMEAVENATVRLGARLDIPRLYAQGLVNTASGEDKRAVARLKSSPTARLLMSVVTPDVKEDNMDPIIAIVVALHEEFKYVFDEFSNRGITLCPKIDDHTGRLIYEGTCNFSTGWRSRLRVVVLGDKGPIRSAIEATRIKLEMDPDVLAIIGIAGGLTDDIALADVVVGTVIDNYIENAKAVTSTDGTYNFQLAGEPFRSDELLADRAKNLPFMRPDLFTGVEETRARSVDVIPATQAKKLRQTKLLRGFSIAAGPVASGPFVGASMPFAEWLLNHNRSYMAIEMESGAAAYSADMLGGRKRTRFLAVAFTYDSE